MKKIFVIVCPMMLSVVGRAAGDWGFAYQAHLLDSAGNVIVDDRGLPVSDQTVEFRIYPSASSSQVLWGRSYSVTCDQKGLFNVFLCDNAEGSSKLPGVADNALQDVLTKMCVPAGPYIGLTVAGGMEIKPRQRICAVPYAAVATVARSLKGVNGAAVTVAGQLEVQGKLDASGVTVNGSSMETKGSLVVTGKVSEQGREFLPFPVFGIILWHDASKAPDGSSWNNGLSKDKCWAQCNGGTYNDIKTPDLRGKLPRGDVAAGSGGAASVTLSEDAIPEHDHIFFADDTYADAITDISIQISACSVAGVYISPNDMKQVGSCGGLANSGGYMPYLKFDMSYGDADEWDYDWEEGKKRTRLVPTGKTGGGKAHDNMPPYQGMLFIMRVK